MNANLLRGKNQRKRIYADTVRRTRRNVRKLTVKEAQWRA